MQQNTSQYSGPKPKFGMQSFLSMYIYIAIKLLLEHRSNESTR